MLDWSNIIKIDSKKYVCGHCGESISSEKGYYATDKRFSGYWAWIYLCHFCEKPTYFSKNGKQVPGPMFGNSVNGISDQMIADLYKEARECISVNAYTSAVLSCRKILMHIAVDKGAKEGLKFIDYVQYLSDKNIIPNGSNDWVDIIREKGNEANHEIVIMDKQDATDMINFTEMLLKIVYEFPSEVEKRKKLQP